MPLVTLNNAPQLHNPALACKSLSTSELGISWNYSGQFSNSPLNGVSPTPHNSINGASPYDCTSSSSTLLAFENQISSPISYPPPCASDWYRVNPYLADVIAAPVLAPWDQYLSSFSESDDDDASVDASAHSDDETTPPAISTQTITPPDSPTTNAKSAAVRKLVSKSFRICTTRSGGRKCVTHVMPPPCARQMREKTLLTDFDINAHWNCAKPARFMCEMRSKCRRGNYISQVEFKVGDLVVCDGDKGLDIGEVTSCISVPSQRRGESPPRAYRRATKPEARHYFALSASESETLAFLRALRDLARDGAAMSVIHHDAYWPFIGLMDFVDVELQADYGKMYVFFRAETPIRFKPLAETLYAFYGCRIWLHQMDRDSPMSSPNTSVGSRR